MAKQVHKRAHHVSPSPKHFPLGPAGPAVADHSAALADNSKISPDLQTLLEQQPSANVNVIVQYNTASSGAGGLLGGVVNLLEGVVNLVFSLIPAVAATLHPAGVVALSNQSNVAYISLDRSLAASLDYSAGAVNAPAAWSAGLDGTGVGIAIIDSGIYSHPDLNRAEFQPIARGLPAELHRWKSIRRFRPWYARGWHRGRKCKLVVRSGRIPYLPGHRPQREPAGSPGAERKWIE